MGVWGVAASLGCKGAGLPVGVPFVAIPFIGDAAAVAPAPGPVAVPGRPFTVATPVLAPTTLLLPLTPPPIVLPATGFLAAAAPPLTLPTALPALATFGPLMLNFEVLPPAKPAPGPETEGPVPTPTPAAARLL